MIVVCVRRGRYHHDYHLCKKGADVTMIVISVCNCSTPSHTDEDQSYLPPAHTWWSGSRWPFFTQMAIMITSIPFSQRWRSWSHLPPSCTDDNHGDSGPFSHIKEHRKLIVIYSIWRKCSFTFQIKSQMEDHT
jgi:hypothetical protein